MSDLKRKKNESFEAFIRRVKQQWQRSAKQSKNVVRKLTVSKVKKNVKTDLLRKTGKLPEEDYKKKRRR